MLRELNSRITSLGVTVSLLWDEETNETTLELETDDGFQSFPVEASEASHAFEHPFVFSARTFARETLSEPLRAI